MAVAEVSNWTQLKILLKKNIWLKKRGYVGTICEFLFPAAIIMLGCVYALLFTMFNEVHWKDTSVDTLTVWNDADPYNDCMDYYDQDPNKCFLGIVPNPHATNDTRLVFIIEGMQNYFYNTTGQNANVMYFDTDEDMKSYYEDDDNKLSLWSGVVFTFQDNSLNYTIRVNNSYVPFTLTNSFSQSFGFGSLWDSNGFLTVQTAVETSFIQFQAMDKSLPFSGLFNLIEQFPFDFASSVGGAFPLIISGFLMYAFIPLMLNSMVALFRERNEKVKETMKMMGMSESMYWVSWYITVTVPAIWICLAMIILGKVCYLFTHSNLFIVFIFAFLFGLSVISFTFLMSIWVKGTLVAAVVTFGWLFLMMNAVTFVVNFSAGAQAFLSLISPIAFCLGMVQIVDLDLFKDGIQFSNINNNDFSVTSAMIMMIVDTIIYSVLNWYFANVFPGEYGIAKSPLFPFQKSYWFPEEPTKSEEERLMNPISDVNMQARDSIQSDNPFIEPVSPDLALRCGVSIRNLRKVYGDSCGPDNCTIAVKNLSVDLYVGEIFGFLGMNGAGKTTTISMLTGLYPPTAGDAFIDGLSIRTSTDLIRKRIGICPQDNILFERLTAREHLTLFGILKGVPQSEIHAKVEEMLVLIGLGDKADKISKTYSGGMKRKLQIGIALMGDSKVVIFDEPTAGMDSVSRRQFWNTLRGMKENRVIILVSHMMEECDVLSDRIGIMKTGEMVCYGTSTFLKNKLGSGDYLNIVGEDSIEKQEVLRFVQRHIPKAKIVSETPTDLSILLPLGTRDKFPDLLGDFESLLSSGKKNELHIKGFGISMTSLEDVFLRITQDDFGPNSNAASAHNSSSNLSINNNNGSNNNLSSNDIKVKIRTPRGSMKQGLLTGNYPAPTWASHFKLLLEMKYLSARRNWKTTLSLLLVPAIFMTVVIGSGKISNLTIDEGSTSMTQLTFTEFFPLIVPYYEATGVDATPLIQPLQYIEPDTTQLTFVQKDPLSSFQDYFFDDDASDRSNHRFGGIQYEGADYTINYFNYTLVYNTSELNSLPAFTNMMSNSVLKYLLNDTTASLLISSYSHPFPGSGLNIEFGNDMMMITFSFIVGFSITMGLLTRTIVYEKQKKIQFQYSILGVNSAVYWITHYLFDYFINFLSFLFLSLSLLAFDVKEYMHIDYLALLIFTMWFLLALVSSNYALSFLFQDAEDCLKYLFVFNLMLGVAPFIAILVFQLALHTTSMDWLKFLFPMATYASGLGSIQTVHSIFDITGESKKLSDFFEWDQLGEKMVYLAIHTVVSIVAIIVVDRLGNKIRFPSNETVPPPPNEDEDVAAERQRLANLDQGEDLIQVKDVMKDYGHFKAVKNITLGIKENECFGLLGPNGAGKTTTISMLTREIEPTSGDVRLCGKSVWNVNKDEHYKIAKPGCCLQFDSLNDYLTGREHLRLYCKLRNSMPPEQVEEVVEEYLEKLNIVIHGNKITKNYSGGTKRKLSVALALMTGNQILYLDEPSTGMDPSARRSLWTAIETERKKPGRAIVLTTHALEEAEAVSQRIGIVVRGQLQCLGSTQHLKSKFEDKYFLFINSKEATMEHIDRFVQETFPGAVLLESYGGSGIKYDIGRLDSVAFAFRSLEENKNRLGITEYSITQTTLEHIFLFFAKRQEEATSGVTAWTDIPQHHQCQFCEANMVTETTYKVGKGSWLAGALLSLVCCCCLGCMVSSFKDVQHSCPNCNKIVGVHKKL